MKRTLYLTDSLIGTDDYYDDLVRLFSRLQSCTVEAAHPTLDLLTFKESLYYYGLIFSVDNGHMDPAVREAVNIHEFEDPITDAGTKFVGFVYLQPSQDPKVPHVHVAELSIGVVLEQESQGKGLAAHVVSRVVEMAFADKDCHRVQAVIIDSPSKHQALSLFVKCGFSVEGTRRRSFLGPYDHVWKDVSYLAILDTDLAVRKQFLTDRSLWDEMLDRHQRENEQLVRWESHHPIKRSLSTETLRIANTTDTEWEVSDVESDAEESVVTKKRRLSIPQTLSATIHDAYSGASNSQPNWPGVQCDAIAYPAARDPFVHNTHSGISSPDINEPSSQYDSLFPRLPSTSNLSSSALVSTSRSLVDYSDDEDDHKSDCTSTSGNDWTSAASYVSSPPRTASPALSESREASRDNTSTVSDGDLSDSGASSWDCVSDQEFASDRD